MPMSPSVVVFNTTSESLQIWINNGNAIQLSPVLQQGSWAPQPQTSGVTWSHSGPAPNAFGPGGNSVQVQALGNTHHGQVTIPGGQPYRALQLYVFAGPGSLGLALLHEGSLITDSFGQGAR